MARILLVEPDQKLAATHANALKLTGHKVHIAATAQQGIIAADDEGPDVVVLEVQLVAHSGVEFLHEFRSYADWQSVPVIVLSHVAPQEFRASQRLLKSLGVAAYLYKPRTSLIALQAAVDDALQASLNIRES